MAREPMVRRLVERVAGLATIAVLLGAALPTAARAADVSFGTPTATSVFLQGITFRQPVVLGSQVDRVELLLTFPGGTGEYVVEVQPPSGSGPTTLMYTWDATADQSLVPNTPIAARWRVRTTGASSALPAGPSITVTYADTRFTWQTATQGIVRVHWYEGDASFGRQALRVATDAISTAEQAFGVTETAPVDFFVYADATAFRQALGPSTGEFVVGRAVPEIRTLFGLLTPGSLGSSDAVTLAHELTHIVFDTATRNPYHVPPHWLNEGVAKYLSEGYGSADRGLVASAASGGTLYPLTSLASAFPTGDAVFLAYAEADAAVDYIVRTYGRDALAKLVDSYAGGRTDDEAFQSALGMGAAAFDAAWFASVGATVPEPAGPSAAPAGPVPPGWGGGGGAVASPGASGPAASGTPGGSAIGGGGSDATATVAGVGVLILVVLVVFVVVLRSRRRPVAAIPAAWPGGGGVGPGGGSLDGEGMAAGSAWRPEDWARPTEPRSEAWSRGPSEDAAIVDPPPAEAATPVEIATPADPATRADTGFHARHWGESDTSSTNATPRPPQP